MYVTLETQKATHIYRLRHVSRVSSVGLNIQRTLHVKPSHTLKDDKTDATVLLVSSTPNKVPHFLSLTNDTSRKELYVPHTQTRADFVFFLSGLKIMSLNSDYMVLL